MKPRTPEEIRVRIAEAVGNIDLSPCKFHTFNACDCILLRTPDYLNDPAAAISLIEWMFNRGFTTSAYKLRGDNGKYRAVFNTHGKQFSASADTFPEAVTMAVLDYIEEGE